MTSAGAGLFALSLAWLAYFALHSLLASLAVKRWVAAHHPGLMPAYRLGFNTVAVLGALPIVWLFYRYPGPTLWQWAGAQAWLANTLALAAVGGFFHSLRFYDMEEFAGLRQLRCGTRTVEDQERFQLSPFHRYVRHPWYFFSLAIVWTRDMNAAMLVSAVMITAYLIVGSRLEERKLLLYHGERYRRYRDKVAGLVPLPWKILARDEADELSGG